MSTEDQAKHGFSIPAQIRECENLVGDCPYLVFADEGFSGENLDRPALIRLREQVRAGNIDKIICLDPDRLSRKLLNQLLLTDEFERSGADIVFVNGDYSKTPEGTLFYAMRGAISEFEKAKITERMSRGRREKAKQGRVLRDFQIYGYDYDSEREKLIINKVEAEVVCLIFRWFISPPVGVRGISGIARILTERKIPTKRGAHKWHRQVVRQILMNRAYIGEFYQNKWVSDKQGVRLRPKEEWILIPCPSIVDKELFNQVQKRLETARRRYAGQESDYLLSGLVRCLHCGSQLTGRRQKSRGKIHFLYAENAQLETGCGFSVSKERLEDAVWNFFIDLLATTDPETVLLPHGSNPQSSLKEELENLRQRKSLIVQELSIQEISASDVAAVLKAFAERERQLEEVLNLANSTPKPSLVKPDDSPLLSRTSNLRWKEKRDLIRILIKEIKVSQDELVIYTF